MTMNQQRATEILDKWTNPKLNMTKDERTIERHKEKYEVNLVFMWVWNEYDHGYGIKTGKK